VYRSGDGREDGVPRVCREAYIPRMYTYHGTQGDYIPGIYTTMVPRGGYIPGIYTT